MPRHDRPRHDGESPPLLRVEDLRTHIHTDRGTVRAVDGVSFTVDRGEAVCVVGESGSGKSVTCESLTGLVPSPPAERVGGSVTFDGTALDDEAARAAVRGDRIGHVFQNPQHALDPVYTVGAQLREAMTAHAALSTDAARRRAVELLDRVGIPEAGSRVDDYPHEFSGGMCQRVAVATALAADPDLLIADEPTTAVDVTVQARLIDLLRELLADGLALLLVTHDLRVVAEVADRVLVMFGGTIVERGPVAAVFENPAHPYTRTLLASYDGFERRADRPARDDLPTDGCRFRAECPHAVEACSGSDQPPAYAVGDGHTASCVHYGPDGDPDRLAEAADRPQSEATDD